MTNSQRDARRKLPYNPVDTLFREELPYVLRDSRDRTRGFKLRIPSFAKNLLNWLTAVGMRRDVKLDSSQDNLRSVELENGQTLFLRCDTYRASAGYMAVEALPTPKSDTAILAAMTAMAAQYMSDKQLDENLHAVSRLWSTLPEDTAADEDKVIESYAFEITRNLENGPSVRAFEGSSPAFGAIDTIEYVVALLRYHRPGFDDLSRQEQADWIVATCERVNTFLKSLRALQEFLDYGAPDRKQNSAVKKPHRDVQAAVWYDVDGLNYREIGLVLDVPLPPDFEIKGEHQTVRKMVVRGRNILEKAFGEDGWRKRVEAMKAEQERWRSLSDDERGKETAAHTLALEFSTSYEEARRWVDANPTDAKVIASSPGFAREMVDLWVQTSLVSYPPFE